MKKISVKSPINWYGGKYYMAKNITEMFPKHRMYVEGFGGAAHVLFKKEASEMEIYNDINSGLHLFFKFLREGNSDFIRRLQLTPYSREEFEESKKWMDEIDEVEKARKFYVRTMQSVACNGGWCYAKSKSRRGMCQSVSRWLGNIEENLEDAVNRLKEVQVEKLDVVDLIDKYDKEDVLFYLDPPYVPDTRKQKKSYEFEMTLEDHKRFIEKLIKTKGMVVLSGYDNDTYNILMDNGWSKIYIGDFSKRSQKSNDGELEKGEEFLWVNFPILDNKNLYQEHKK